MSVCSPPEAETIERFACFGGHCTVIVQGRGPGGPAAEAAARARNRLLAWHRQFSRFDPGSELSRLNRDPRPTVPVSDTMMSLIEAGLWAAARTDGLVDPTLVTEIEQAGYAGHFDSVALPLSVGLRLAPPRRAAEPSPEARWRGVTVDRDAQTIHRAVGIRLDSGGIAKGLVGDLLASKLRHHPSFAVEAAGDIRFGGADGLLRPVQVASPFDGAILHTFELTEGAAATSGIGRRSWLDARGRPAHHLLDPATGRPAYTGVVQATALAPSGVEAEALAKAALLSGPANARGWLPHGGLIVHENGYHEVIEETGA